MYMYVCVDVWVCGCVDVWMCGRTCRCAMLRFLSLLFSSVFLSVSPASGPSWPMLVPGIVMSTVSCRYFGFGRDHDVSPHFLLHPFLSLFAKS